MLRVRILKVVASVDFFQKGILKNVGKGNPLQKTVHFPSPSPHFLKIRNMACFQCSFACHSVFESVFGFGSKKSPS